MSEFSLGHAHQNLIIINLLYRMFSPVLRKALTTGLLCCPLLGAGYSTSSPHYEVVIGGGGIMGCSTAFFLAQRIPPSSICIIERDPEVRGVSFIQREESVSAYLLNKQELIKTSFHTTDC